jgi:hypothetical protein
MPPGLEASGSGFKCRLELPVAEIFERLQDLTVIWVNALVGHGFILFQNSPCGIDPDHLV